MFSFITLYFTQQKLLTYLNRGPSNNVIYRYQNHGSLVGGKQQGECLKVQWPTPTLSVFVSWIAYKVGFFHKLKAHLVD